MVHPRQQDLRIYQYGIDKQRLERVKQTFCHVNTGLESPEQIGIRAMGISTRPQKLQVSPYFGLPRGTSCATTRATGFGIPANSNASTAYSRVAGNSKSQMDERKAKGEEA